MRTFAAICISACLGMLSFTPLSTTTGKSHAWKSSRHSAVKIPSEPRPDLLTTQSLSAFVVASSSAATVTTTSVPAPPLAPPVTPAPITTVPPEWQGVAQCEEGGRNDPNYGYFGIQEWHGFGGYPTAGSAPLQVQLDWEYAKIVPVMGIPTESPWTSCHGY